MTTAFLPDRVVLTEPPQVSQNERKRVFAFHRRMDYISANDEAETLIKVDPYCGFCREQWGRYGCATVRMMARLAFMEESERAAQASEEKMREALAKVSVTPRWEMIRANDLLQCHIEVAGHALRAGGPRVVESSLREMYTAIEAEYRKVTA